MSDETVVIPRPAAPAPAAADGPGGCVESPWPWLTIMVIWVSVTGSTWAVYAALPPEALLGGWTWVLFAAYAAAAYVAAVVATCLIATD